MRSSPVPSLLPHHVPRGLGIGILSPGLGASCLLLGLLGALCEQGSERNEWVDGGAAAIAGALARFFHAFHVLGLLDVRLHPVLDVVFVFAVRVVRLVR